MRRPGVDEHRLRFRGRLLPRLAEKPLGTQ
jgi:hypothetical protein